MVYPEHLLPQVNYFKIQPSEELGRMFLLRHTPDSDMFDPETEELKASYIELSTDNLKDISTNLLGVFTFEDRIYKIKKESPNKDYFNQIWEEGEEVVVPIYDTDFEVDETKDAFYLKISDIEGKEISHTNGQTGEIWTARAVILHTPTNCNFWHFSIRWYDENGDIVSESKSRRKKILTHARTIIRQYAVFELPENQEIADNFYSK